jgi:hypothetical protein
LAPTEKWFELELQLVDGFAVLSRAELRVGIDGAIPPYTGMPPAQAAALAELAEGNVLYGETVPAGPLAGTVADRINAVLDDAGWPAGLTDVFSGNVRVGPKAYAPGTSALDALWDAPTPNSRVANLWMSKAGLLTFRGRCQVPPRCCPVRIQRFSVADPANQSLPTGCRPPNWNGQGMTACSTRRPRHRKGSA